MIGVLRKIWAFAGNKQNEIKKSVIIDFFNAVFYALMFVAIFVVLNALVTGSTDMRVAWAALGLMLASILGRIVTRYFSMLQQTNAGYFMVAEKRIRIGDKLKVIPMGYFNQNSLGNITAMATTILGDVENQAPRVLVLVLGGLITTVVFTLAILLFDWRIGLVVAAGLLVFLWTASLTERRSRSDSPRRQAAQEGLVEAVLETVQGMGVVKAFSLDAERDKKVDRAIEESCAKETALTKALTPYNALQQVVLWLFSVGIILASILFYLGGSMTLVVCLMMLIVSFVVFEQLLSVGNGVALLQLTAASIDRANEIDRVPVMGEGGKAIAPRSFDIEFENVGFSYGKRPVLQDVNFKIPEGTTTAIVGPSGSGKTTICNLIARFWDVDFGSVRIGGRGVREYTPDSLLSNISMVFQNVYLFNDTIENNIKFGSPSATHEQVVEAAKKACCHDFITDLPDGYDTVLGEGGATVSGGERQRISIARALLKDAPIVLLDEATANVDPENEDQLQRAIESLTREKTIVMIAHRLKTVRNADQILVLNGGRVVQRGTHEELLSRPGFYADFVDARKKAIGWKLGGTVPAAG
ncbi:MULTISPECIES: ABC transporter ATP-binding protein [unclassified Methanoculleus]|jgi:ATP-binding cassette subfamily B protein|uniref:ABC transporter ATP-binding protein n=1 Tax=Methanoculleus palmolei TaxID=72612 RepID=A0ABD8A997_9EURY|nr:ABC transporter ATP-binding protein [Methanoculleus sp. UBA377]WOX55181.1 ABC transporter ATP-binding protein [Methanoculleus palmolei]